jgi:hypothetical protein
MPATVLGDQYVTIGVGTTALRPGTPTQGMLRYNTTLSLTEINTDGTVNGWNAVAVSAYNILAVDTSGNLVHQQVVGSDTNTTLTAGTLENALAHFFSNKLSLALDSSGNLTATY